jgi:hypothetical protein
MGQPSRTSGSYVLLAFLLSSSLGAVGGGILALPLWPFGAIVGLMFAAPVGPLIGSSIWLLRRPPLAVVTACLCQFCGALILGFSLRGPHFGDGFYGACCGQILGTILGVLAAVLWPVVPTHPRPNTHCRQCEYELRGNVSGVCPECGTKIPDDQLDLIRTSSSPGPQRQNEGAS